MCENRRCSPSLVIAEAQLTHLTEIFIDRRSWKCRNRYKEHWRSTFAALKAQTDAIVQIQRQLGVLPLPRHARAWKTFRQMCYGYLTSDRSLGTGGCLSWFSQTRAKRIVKLIALSTRYLKRCQLFHVGMVSPKIEFWWCTLISPLPLFQEPCHCWLRRRCEYSKFHPLTSDPTSEVLLSSRAVFPFHYFDATRLASLELVCSFKSLCNFGALSAAWMRSYSKHILYNNKDALTRLLLHLLEEYIDHCPRQHGLIDHEYTAASGYRYWTHGANIFLTVPNRG